MNKRSRDWMSRRAVVALLGALLLVAGTAGHHASAQPATVRLVIDYGDGVIKTIVDLPWAKGHTVLDVMNAAKTRSHGINFAYSGSGGTAFLTQIDDASRTRAAGAARRTGNSGSTPAMLTAVSAHMRCRHSTWCSGATRRRK